MGFKADTSFLRFLTMGALGVQQVVTQLKNIGFQPIELERYCASNKIWTTKVKRLRLPDLLCVKTGLRVEVRAKSDLKIRMSHAEKNPDRYWDAGLYTNDLIAFITCHNNDLNICTAESALFFSVGDLQEKVDTASLGTPKSASEGAERDLTWPCTVPQKDGVVLAVEDARIRTQLDEGRKQTYSIKGKNPYVSPGDRFIGLESIIAGTVAGPVDVRERINDTWDLTSLLHSDVDIDRYAATKAMPYSDLVSRNNAISLLETSIDEEGEERVALEMGSSLARMDSQKGFDFICDKIERPAEAYIPMESVFILTEIADSNSVNELMRIITDAKYAENEIRQAAVWGVGKAGAKAYNKLIQFIDDNEDDVALHAIAAFGPDTDNATVDNLIGLLISGDQRQKAAACESLRLIQSDYVLSQLIQAENTNQSEKSWIITTLGQFHPDSVRGALANNPLLDQIQPFFNMSNQENWLAIDEKNTDLRFLLGQNIF